ncbi:MAG: peptidyl-tRNA hydrolase [Benniella sp.]|nr:MAG: peptidyl-tRNA hydrolase [Benniella sp.]
MASKHILVVGLGNFTHPGTRHNVGMMVVDNMARRFNAEWNLRNQWQADCATAHTTIAIKKRKLMHPMESERGPHAAASGVQPPKKEPAEIVDVDVQLTLLKPRQLMNVSGSSISRAAKELKISVPHIMIVHDDMERDIGKMSFKSYGSAGGHNGIKSCIKSLGSQHFKRLRIGIGRPPFKSRASDLVADYVLSKFKRSELEVLEEHVFDKAADEIIRVMTSPADPANR